MGVVEGRNRMINMKYINVRCSTGKMLGNHFICSSMDINSILDIDINSGNIDILGFFKDVNDARENMYRDSCTLNSEEIAFFPENASCIAVYNYKTDAVKTIDLGLGKNAEYNAYKNNNSIILFPLDGSNPILSWD